MINLFARLTHDILIIFDTPCSFHNCDLVHLQSPIHWQLRLLLEYSLLYDTIMRAVLNAMGLDRYQ